MPPRIDTSLTYQSEWLYGEQSPPKDFLWSHVLKIRCVAAFTGIEGTTFTHIPVTGFISDTSQWQLQGIRYTYTRQQIAFNQISDEASIDPNLRNTKSVGYVPGDDDDIINLGEISFFWSIGNSWSEPATINVCLNWRPRPFVIGHETGKEYRLTVAQIKGMQSQISSQNTLFRNLRPYSNLNSGATVTGPLGHTLSGNELELWNLLRLHYPFTLNRFKKIAYIDYNKHEDTTAHVTPYAQSLSVYYDSTKDSTRLLNFMYTIDDDDEVSLDDYLDGDSSTGSANTATLDAKIKKIQMGTY